MINGHVVQCMFPKFSSLAKQSLRQDLMFFLMFFQLFQYDSLVLMRTTMDKVVSRIHSSVNELFVESCVLRDDSLHYWKKYRLSGSPLPPYSQLRDSRYCLLNQRPTDWSEPHPLPAFTLWSKRVLSMCTCPRPPAITRFCFRYLVLYIHIRDGHNSPPWKPVTHQP